MTSGGIALTAWSQALAGALYSGLAVQLLRLGYARKAGASRAMLAAVLCSAVWGWLGLADQFTSKLVFWWLGALVDCLVYGSWLLFLVHLLRPNADSDMSGNVVFLSRAAALAVVICLLLQLLVGLQLGGFTEGSKLVLLSWMLLPVLALVLVEQLLRNVHEDALWNAKPLCLGLAGIFLFDLYLFSQSVLFGGHDSDALSIRGAVHALMVPLLFLAVTRRSDLISSLRLSRKAAFHSATLLLAGVYLLFISGVGYYVRYFGGEWGRALQLGLFFLALVVLTILALSGSVRARVRVFLGKHFFRYRYDYREEWLRFTQTLAAQHSPQQMGQQVIRGLADMLESPAGALWMKSPSDQRFRQAAQWNMVPVDDVEEGESVLCQFMSRTGWVINLEEYRSIPRRYAELTLPEWLLGMSQAWLIVPLCVGDELIGFVILASARTDFDVNWEVTDLLKTAGRQAASFLAQMQATEALLEVRKFDAFNRMSAFVVHDLKNIVTQLSLLMKNAKRLHANPEFQQDMLMTIENSLDKMRQLMLQLREGETPTGTAFGVDLCHLAQRIGSGVSARGRGIDLQLLDRVFARGHEERLERVIGHVVQNALDATDSGGEVSLRVDRQAGQARVEVRDNGHGMSQEFVRDRLFRPFQTTKKTGMGIGAYESFQYVRELGGSISVHSEPGRGTEVTLLLPLFEAQTDSDFQMLASS
jgi:putative PEP-CTERM system histidine kinase